jgi:hypothetical protein
MIYYGQHSTFIRILSFVQLEYRVVYITVSDGQ